MFRARLLVLDAEHRVLLLNLHHIIADGWSIGVLVREWSALYGAACQDIAVGQDRELAPLPIDYSDYAAWQRAWLAGEVLEHQLAYWRTQLADAPLLLELPTDRPRPPVQSYRGAHLEQILDAGLNARIEALARSQGATVYMTLLAAFQVLLARHSGQDDILVGSPIANRTRSETEGLIGLFVIPWCCALGSIPRSRSTSSSMRCGAWPWRPMPTRTFLFEQLVEALNPERSLSHSPLFQVMFVLQNAPIGELDLPGLSLTPLEQPFPVAKFDLTLSVMVRDGELHCNWEYATDLFEAATIARFAERYRTLLEVITEVPERALAALSLLTETERQQLQDLERHRGGLPAGPDYCRSVRATGRQDTRQHRRGIRRGDPELCRAQRPRQPSGAFSHRTRRRAGHPGGAVCRALAADDRGAAWHSQGRWRLCAVGSQLSLRHASTFMLEDSGVALLLTQEKIKDRLAQAP